MNRIKSLFASKPKNVLNIFCTAGYPNVSDIVPIIHALQDAGADIIEIGIPYSDPTADGPTIQQSNNMSLANGMTLKLLLEQLKDIRKTIHIPLIMMGDINPILQFGFIEFLDACQQIGIDGLILPNLPMREYELHYKTAFESRSISNIFLVTPQTSEARIRKIDELTNGFIYVVSTASITGGELSVSDQAEYFNGIKNMQLKNPALIGFGIRDNETFKAACTYLNGAIIGSAFIKALEGSTDVQKTTHQFVHQILKG
jgi:tryptophan synthase alpha chain